MIVDTEPGEPGRSDLRAMARVLRGRAALIASTTAIGLAMGAALIALTPPRWDAEAVVALDARRIQLAPSDALVSRLPNEAQALRTELDVIHSRRMAERVLVALGEEMEARLASPAWNETRRDRIVALISGVAGAARAQAPFPAASPAPGGRGDAADRREAAIAALTDNLRASNDNRSYTIFFAYSAPEPAAAALIANAYAQAYLDHRTASQSSATDQVRDMLGERVAVLREQVSDIESQVEKLRREAGLVDPEGLTLQERRIAALNLELAAARSERATADARLAAAREAIGADALAADALSSDAIVALRRERDSMRREAAEIARAGATKSERLSALRGALIDIDARLASELELFVRTLEAEARFTGAREAELGETLARMEERAMEIEAARSDVRRLEREAAASREIYDAFLGRYKQAIEQAGLALPDAMLITPATTPGAAASPRMGPTLALALFAGLSGGIGLAFAADRLDGRIRSVGAVEGAARAPVLARIPRSRLKRPHLAVLDRRRKARANGLDGLRAALTLSARTRTAKVVAITSARSREGVTTVAVALARSAALAGRKVAYVELGPRSPIAAAVFGHPGADGPNRDAATGAVRFGLRDPGQEIAMGRPEFETFLRRLRKEYEFVVIDAPSLSDSADAAFAGALADATLLVARWGRTTYEQVAAAARELALCGAPVAGVVLNGTPAETVLNGVDFTHRPPLEAPRIAIDRDDAPPDGRQSTEGLRVVGRDAGTDISGGVR